MTRTTVPNDDGVPDAEASASTFGFDFSQTMRLTTRLHQIIRGYPRGLGILKEFIQNADDAGATTLQIIMDWRQHRAERLPDRRMKRLMGPALLLANDKPFSDDDLEAIRRIGEGSKRDSAPKTGRFGLGFNTSYNITDYPSFLTRNSVYCFDPHQNVVVQLPSQAQTFGRGWELEDLWRRAPDWPAAFAVAGAPPGVKSYDGTVFRLPLRMSATAAESEICKEAFTESDFRELANKAMHSSSELLLFTKNLQELSIREVSEQGIERFLLRVRAAEPEVVRSARSQVLTSMEGTTSKVLTDLTKTAGPLPVASYDHRFVVETDQERDETWHVVSGLWRGEDDRLLRAAKEMARHGEKAVPWVGVAACLAEDGATVRACAGGLFCSLPLPVEVQLPVHIHAYFDLDESRQGLTVEHDDQGRSIAARAEWNRALLEEGAARVWTTLLQNLAARSVAGFYEVWPDLTSATGMLRRAFEGVYRMTSSIALITARRKDKVMRVAASTIALPPKKWREELHDPLVADDYPMPEPPLPAHIEEGYKGVLIALTPQAVRHRLRATQDLNVPPQQATRSCLQQVSWVESLLRFCLSDNKVDDIAGLPLALLDDGRLHTFKHVNGGTIFLTTEIQRRIFVQQKHWYLEPDFQESTNVPPNQAAGVFRMAPRSVIFNLEHVVGKVAQVPWSPKDQKAPHETWLADVFAYLSSSTIAPDELELLRGLPVVPASDGQLHASSRTNAPLWIQPADAQQPLARVLRELGVLLVEIPAVAREAFSKFTQLHPRFLYGISATQVICRLHEKGDALRVSRPQATVLLDYFSEARWSYRAEDILKLKQLPLFPSATTMVRASDHGVYLPSGFQAPSLGLKMFLVDLGDRWGRLYSKLEIPELGPRAFLEEMLLPALPGLPEGDLWTAWRWIKDTFSAHLMDDGEKQLRGKLASVNGFPASDGSLRAIAILHDPTSKVVSDVLGSSALYPQLASQRDKESWLQFLRNLSLIRSPQPKELLAHIDALRGKGLSAEPALRKVWDHIVEHWEALSKRAVLDGGQRVGFPIALSGRAWLPAVPSSAAPGFRMPEQRLFRAGELHQDVNLVGSQAPVIAWRHGTHVAVQLGMARTPRLELVMDHFDCLLASFAVEGQTARASRNLGAALGYIYKYLKRRLGDELQENGGAAGITSDERRRLRRYPSILCIWDDPTNRLWPPYHVFTRSPLNLQPLRLCVSSPFGPAFELLGARSAPGTSDFVAYLEDIRDASQGAISAGDRTKVLAVLKEIVGQRVPSSLPLPTRDRRLLSASEVYRDDAPWLRGRTGTLPIADDAIPHELLEELALRRLSTSVEEILVEARRGTVDELAAASCRNMKTRLRSSEFLQGLVRLVRHEHGPDRMPEARMIRAIELYPVESIITELRVIGDESLGEAEAKVYFDESNNRLYLTMSSEGRVASALANAIQQVLGELRLSDRAPLEHILICEPNEVQEALDDDRIAVVQINDFQIPDDVRTLTDDVDPDFSEDDAPASDGMARGAGQLAATDGDDDDLPSDGPGPPMDPGGRAASGMRPPPVAARAELPLREGLSQPNSLGEDEGLRVSHSTGGSWLRASGPSGLRGFPADSFSTAPGPSHGKWASSSGDGPPLTPGVGHSRSAQLSMSAPLVLTSHGGEITEVSAEARDAALKVVYAHEEAAGRKCTPATDGTYDLESEHPVSGERRRIKVKGVSADWRGHPVSLAQAHIEGALKLREEYWLYVVERLAGTPKLHRIKDPAGNIRMFAFDAGWAVLAEGRIAPTSPEVGMRVLQGGALLGEIVRVSGAGVLRRITIRSPDGSEKTILYRPDQHQLEVNDGNDET